MTLDELLKKRANATCAKRFSEIKEQSGRFRMPLLPGREGLGVFDRENSEFLIGIHYDRQFFSHWNRLLEVERYAMGYLMEIASMERQAVHEQLGHKRHRISEKFLKAEKAMDQERLNRTTQTFFIWMYSLIDQVYYLAAANYKIPINYLPNDRKTICDALEKKNEPLARVLYEKLTYCARQLELNDLRKSSVHHIPKIRAFVEDNASSMDRTAFKAEVSSSYCKGEVLLFDYLFKFYRSTLESGSQAMSLTEWHPDRRQAKKVVADLKLFSDTLEEYLKDKKKKD